MREYCQWHWERKPFWLSTRKYYYLFRQASVGSCFYTAVLVLLIGYKCSSFMELTLMAFVSAGAMPMATSTFILDSPHSSVACMHIHPPSSISPKPKQPDENGRHGFLTFLLTGGSLAWFRQNRTSFCKLFLFFFFFLFFCIKNGRKKSFATGEMVHTPTLSISRPGSYSRLTGLFSFSFQTYRQYYMLTQIQPSKTDRDQRQTCLTNQPSFLLKRNLWKAAFCFG